jgi:hypothetical protein
MSSRKWLIWDSVEGRFCEGSDKFVMFASDDGRAFAPTLEMFPSTGHHLEGETVYEGDLILCVDAKATPEAATHVISDNLTAKIVRYCTSGGRIVLAAAGKSTGWHQVTGKICRIGHSKEHPNLALDVDAGQDSGALRRVLAGKDISAGEIGNKLAGSTKRAAKPLQSVSASMKGFAVSAANDSIAEAFRKKHAEEVQRQMARGPKAGGVPERPFFEALSD